VRILLYLGLLLLWTGTASADPEMLYVGAGITSDSLSHFILNENPENTRGYPDISATSWKAVVAFRPLDWFAVEADYFATAGTTNSFTGDRSEVRALAAYAVGLLPEGEHFDLYLKAGINDYTLTAPSGSGYGESDNGVGFAAGVGVQAHFRRFGVRVEYEVLPNLGKTNGLRAVSLSVLLNLL
jgi:outer membrane protein with beta-barrel domain